MIVIDPLDIDVGLCFLMFWDEKYFDLLLVAVRIIFSLIRVEVKQGEWYALISRYPSVVGYGTWIYPLPYVRVF